ncbi:hypothetical protein H0H92_008497 [Tricholoma furcatifolium]|nr:hypothetical protein H0H92_008497 [Tricholoma furcatifolium]
MRAAIVQTGLLTGIFSILALVSFLKYPTTMFYGLFGILIGRIYTTRSTDFNGYAASEAQS